MIVLAAAAALCISDHAALPLDGKGFEVTWVHSVEKLEWKEIWSVSGRWMQLDDVFIKGSGAGMEPAPHAKLINGWWWWPPSPDIVIDEIILAASGRTGGGWRICALSDAKDCVTVGLTESEPITLKPCQ